ncbi:MAG TPA: PilZ domain-containing protein, partial [Pyrinomonadaceae bacterium]|nr:PilZ domain-containing protein [Pyrinomonadaceae bacterium]
LSPIPSSSQRKHTRHNMPIDVLLETLDEKGVRAQAENTVTENISARGATLFTSLAIQVGRLVRLTSPQYNLTVFASVRSVSTTSGGTGRIHVEFIDREWPL